MRKPCLLLCMIVVLCNCTTIPFLDISTVNISKTDRNTTIYYHQKYSFNTKNTITTHQIIQVGANRYTTPELLYIFDSPIEKLVSYNARTIHQNKTVKSFDLKDLVKVSLSSAKSISTQNVFMAPIDEIISKGDLIESIVVHEYTEPFLGVQFSLGQIPYLINDANCTIELPAGTSLLYKVINDSITPTINVQDNKKIYSFHWDSWAPSPGNNIFLNDNIEPGVLAQPVLQSRERNWSDFGDYYLELVRDKLASEKCASIAKTITKGLATDKEKMDVIATWCREQIRYEQVYISKGEIIPHSVDETLVNKYGDCKDYAAIIYCMAKSQGLNAHLALTYRGRQKKFFADVPVSQFNHALVYFNDHNKDYWYDGTNRFGRPDITNMDLINKHALVIQKHNSRIKQITENTENCLKITGALKPSGSNLAGDLTIELTYQFAIPFIYTEQYLKSSHFHKVIQNWTNQNISSIIQLKNLKIQTDSDRVTIKSSCTFSNSVITIGDCQYSSMARIFNQLLPARKSAIADGPVYYYPDYNHVQINLQLDGGHGPGPASIQYHYDFPAGPMTDKEIQSFKQDFNNTANKFNETFQF